jgi:uncharacterized Zn finger protein
LLQGRFSDHVMGILTRKDTGLFPTPKEIGLKCSCPDWATMCKHVAEVLYGVGARLDQSPELLFTLRSVKHEELISQAATASGITGKTAAAGPELAESELGEVFGIELDAPASTRSPVPGPEPAAAAASRPRRSQQKGSSKAAGPAAKRRQVKPRTLKRRGE